MQPGADTYPRQTGIDAYHYVFRLTLSDDSDEIVGDATVDLRFVREGVSEFALDLVQGMTVSEVSSGGAAVRIALASDSGTL